MRSEYEAKVKKAADLEAKAVAGGNRRQPRRGPQAPSAGRRASSPKIIVEMSFNVYRTTKGKVGEPVYADSRRPTPAPEPSLRGHFSRSRNTTPTASCCPPQSWPARWGR